MDEFDKSTQAVLKGLYEKLAVDSELSISAPDYQQTQIDVLVGAGFLKKIDASTLSGWSYIVKPTYAGNNYFTQLKAEKAAKARHNAIEVIKWLIPTLISIAALIIAIVK